MFVCMILRGTFVKCEYQLGCGLKPGYDSHIDPYGNEWILFDERQVLPVYLIREKAVKIELPTCFAPILADDRNSKETELAKESKREATQTNEAAMKLAINQQPKHKKGGKSASH